MRDQEKWPTYSKETAPWPADLERAIETQRPLPREAPEADAQEFWERTRKAFPRISEAILRATYQATFHHLGRAKGQQPSPSQEPASAADVSNIEQQALKANLTGIAFSGGGIRSATFGLGVLQVLAEMDLLRRFDYVSSVSGGGYLNSWLQAWMRRAGFERVNYALSCDGKALSSFDRRNLQQPIHFLRQFSNYLTPKMSLTSGDRWAAVAIYLRNLLLNLAVTLGILGFALLLPYALRSLVVVAADPRYEPAVLSLCTAGIIAAAWLSVSTVSSSLAALDPAVSQTGNVERLDHRRVNRRVLIPAFVGSSLITVLIASHHVGRSQWKLAAVWIVLSSVGQFALWLSIDTLKRPAVIPGRGLLVLTSLLSGALMGALLTVVNVNLPPLDTHGLLYSNGSGGVWYRVPLSGNLLLISGPPLVMAVLLFGWVFQIGLLGAPFSDSKREWLGRAGGLLTLYSCAWILVFGVSLYAPPLLLALLKRLDSPHLWVKVAAYASSFGLGGGWLATTIMGLSAAKGDKTPATKYQFKVESEPNNSTGRVQTQAPVDWRNLLAVVAPYVFTAGILVIVATLEYLLLAKRAPGAREFFVLTSWSVLLGVATIALAWRIDVNEFSMHMFYRNRLARCYLGASNPRRQPNPFTGFAKDDDLRLHDLADYAQGDATVPGPYPILNATLNVAGGDDLAFQKRNGNNFIFTPLFCGYDRQPSGDPPPLHDHAYRPSLYYGRGELLRRPPGLSLATAMAISGAALSPNMGYYSSKPTAFLLTLFNVRLGWWMGNPRRNDRWQRQGPIFGLKYLMAELLGTANDKRSHIYLSDGGHFENLGLYELVRRRCRFIVVSDGGRDPDYSFGDLGSAIEKCRVDFGVSIDIDLDPLRPTPANSGKSAQHFALGTIRYRAEEQGMLLYLKLSIAGDEPVDVSTYRVTNPAFPHDSTADQWFTEQQFEAYRQLGYTAASSAILAGLNPVQDSHVSLCKALSDYFGTPIPVMARGA